MIEEAKTPIYYQRINDIFVLMNKAVFLNNGSQYVRMLRQLYLFIRNELNEEKQEHFDEMVSTIDSPFENYKQFQFELFDEIHKLEVFKYLKENMELI